MKTTKVWQGLALLVGGVVACLTPTEVLAVNRTKLDNSLVLTNASSWDPSAKPTSIDTLIWDSTVVAVENCTNDLGGSMTVGGIKIVNPATDVNIYTSSGSAGLTVHLAGIDLSTATRDLSIVIPSGASFVANGTQTWNIASDRTVNFDSKVYLQNSPANTGSVMLSGGGVLRSVATSSGMIFDIAHGAASTGTLMVSDVTLYVSNKFMLAGGAGSQGNVYQTGGATYLYGLGVLGSSSNTWAVYDIAGGLLSSATNLYLGSDLGRSNVVSQLIIRDTGTAVVKNILLGGIEGTNGTATLTLKTGGTLSLNSLTTDSTAVNSTLLVAFDGGTLKPTGANLTFFSSMTQKAGSIGTSLATLSTNGAIFDTSGYDITVAQKLEDASGQAGRLLKNGLGMLTLSGANIYNGDTTISGGTLAVSGSGAINSPNATLNVASGTLTLTGTVSVATLLITNTASTFNFQGGTLTTSNANGTAANIQTVSGTGLDIGLAGTSSTALGNTVGTIWNMNGGTNYISAASANNFNIGRWADNVVVNVNSGAVLVVTNAGISIGRGGGSTNDVLKINGGIVLIPNGLQVGRQTATGGNTSGHSLIITNGGQLLVSAGLGTASVSKQYIGYGSNGGANSNWVYVGGANGAGIPATWNLGGNTLTIGYLTATGNWLTVASGGVLTNGNVTLGGVGSALYLNGGTLAAGCAVTVGSSGTFGGPGVVNGPVTNNANGTLYPSAAVGGTQTLTISNTLTFADSSSTCQVAVAESASDLIITTGNVALNNATLKLNGTLSAASYVILQTSGTLSGTFNGLANHAQIPSTSYYIHYVTSSSPNYIVLNQSPTPVVLLQLQALTVGGKVTVRWSTSSESKTAGFDLYRVVNGQSVKLNDTLIAAKGWPNGGIGASYSVADSGAQPGQTYTYKLVERTTDGQSIDYGPYDRTVSEFVMKPLEVTAAGAKVRWLSRAGETYRVLKCTDLSRGQYQPIAENIASTPPENEYLDVAPGNSGFYRIELQP